jgi:hypothetical protein
VIGRKLLNLSEERKKMDKLKIERKKYRKRIN